MTAEKMINSKYTEFEDLQCGNIWVNIENLMIEFAKYHIDLSMKEMAKKDNNVNWLYLGQEELIENTLNNIK